MPEITSFGHPVVVVYTAKEILSYYDTVVKYYDFDYSCIRPELDKAVYLSEYGIEYVETDRIDHLPEDYKIEFSYTNIREFIEITKRYSFINHEDVLFDMLLFSLKFIPRLVDYSEIFESQGMDKGFDDIMQGEKRRLYEFLLDNKHEFKESNPAKAQMTLRYGFESQIEIGNYNNWLHNLLKEALHNDLTFYGSHEYERHIEPKRPPRTPPFANFIAYNTYLLVKEKIGIKEKLPAELVRFLIEFCGILNLKIDSVQNEIEGMEGLIKSAIKKYNGKPIPFSLVRPK